ncbi:TadE/TadG family type IV pilus assembly protein [Methylobacterium oxalidis]|uniref:Pilus biosynthesis protein TadE n=1 Tax=Methylobacterium oxalidis TaxID=944322 RepID=A0A512J970_9HYPH|nr:TadE/TadG family type IV pilus assembly protein [Methylobacterium oxalidis]GEP06399.1 pilus biosynthesis protein TadE [Methylobacterium oxalidis]GJE32313.1 hypothetical protein LDDCCGHA_2499 [Methylobacterium oxalidis]GLS63095.1 pilus biosynthesis protein TadE [Methylobacterium oxalidis]
MTATDRSARAVAMPGATRPPVRRPATLAARLLACRAGVSAVEFALICPVILALILGGVDLSRYIAYTRKVGEAAQTIASLVTQNASGSVNLYDLYFANDSSMVIFPDALRDAKARGSAWYETILITITSVKFSQTSASCTGNCSYTAKVAWSYGLRQRPCNVALTPASDTAEPTPGTLPANVFGPGSVIVVEAAYVFTPILANALIGTRVIARTSYLAPRYVPAIAFDPGMGSTATTVCPGV